MRRLVAIISAATIVAGAILLLSQPSGPAVEAAGCADPVRGEASDFAQAGWVEAAR